MSKLEEWCESQDAWVADALRRAALAGAATDSDADAIAVRVQAAHRIAKASSPECVSYTDECLAPSADNKEVEILCSIGPLQHVDRLTDGQELKFALDGLTVVYGENGSGKSGYARAARRLSTSRISKQLQGDVFADFDGQPTVTFTLKSGNNEARTHTWVEGEQLPLACREMSFLDTANAREYIAGKTEILFLPAEVQCLTTLGQLYGLASERCQSEANKLALAHGEPLSAQFAPTTEAGRLVSLLTKTTELERLPTVEQLRNAAEWDENDTNQLNEIRRQLAEGPASQARTLRRSGQAAKAIADKAVTAIVPLGQPQLDRDVALVQALSGARATLATLTEEQAGRYPIAETGSDTWRELFIFARKFAAETGLVPEDGAFAVGDPCMLCQRPLDEQARDRLNDFDSYIEGAAARAVSTAEADVSERLEVLKSLDLDTSDQVLLALSELGERDETLRAVTEGFAATADGLRIRRDQMVAHLESGEAVEEIPQVWPIVSLFQLAERFIARADELEKSGGVDQSALNAEIELRDRQTLVNCIDLVVARRDGLADRQRYLSCVEALGTRPVSRFASTLRGELVTPELRERIEREIEALAIEHIPLRFTEQSESGKSFFEMALDTPSSAKKSVVLSEGEQRALAIACFFADAHVSSSKGAIIVDDPVTSLDHQRIRRVAQRFATEASKGRQVIIFTHNLLFYQEILRTCADQDPQVKALPCLIQKSRDRFGLVTSNDQPWIAKKVKERVRALHAQLCAIPDGLAPEGEEMRILAKNFYTDLRETWERAVEEVVLGGVVERFGTDVKTLSLKRVDLADEDYRTVFFAMKRASERSGHDQAAAKQIAPPDKDQMRSDLQELQGFIATQKKKADAAQDRRKALETAPAAATI